MANFDPSVSRNSTVIYWDNGNRSLLLIAHFCLNMEQLSTLSFSLCLCLFWLQPAVYSGTDRIKSGLAWLSVITSRKYWHGLTASQQIVLQRYYFKLQMTHAAHAQRAATLAARVQLQPVALCCMSSPLSLSSFCKTLCCSIQRKAKSQKKQQEKNWSQQRSSQASKVANTECSPNYKYPTMLKKYFLCESETRFNRQSREMQFFRQK